MLLVFVNPPIFHWSLQVRPGPPKFSTKEPRFPVFTGWMLFLSANQQCRSTDVIRCKWIKSEKNLMLQVAEMIRHVIDRYTQTIPAILEIPSKDHPYDASKDSILRRAKVGEYSLPVSVLHFPSVLWHCRLGNRKGIQPVITSSSADADNGLDAFSGQSRSITIHPSIHPYVY